LLQALIKNSRMEWLVQKAVELGVSQIMPVTAEHSVVKAKTAGGEARRQRLLSVAVSAQKQCSILWLPEITEPMSLEEALNSVSENNDTLVLYGALEVAALPLRECLRTRKGNVPQQIALAVGPEGDFSMQEYGLLEESGAMAVSLGNNILRSETAALHMISALRYEFATV
jgi:16S rRNA (uracil1498-N3)-methyltransferase